VVSARQRFEDGRECPAGRDVVGQGGLLHPHDAHSSDALRPLAPEAIWASIRWEVFRGKLEIHDLRAIEGTVDAQAWSSLKTILLQTGCWHCRGAKRTLTLMLFEPIH